ncbi:MULTISPECIES: hypothetical protein [Paenarthrobacter]|uniref:Uncharacterized protein n=1 Tax=Paenarthrobacter ureafaciens TaxID=37931 RepID=A0AAX3EKC5_PAEUR|nr:MULTISPECIES: hypothetical protein [Paenarthrobacter]NKR12496.1 hypothetical protein [Arthrobacter sp. M5]NKR14326.1 hypothetical protein [Arthrobacter sp. M6]OEH61797.1 hypothetical protein A5N13_15565 [Arthrobacter sp. D4]OEH64099.1 hypothetical protein A5N17_06545 [Arthrobacter sp. D2]MDO5863424.1 hypothetical protein [Paenarthrobacter sp. SD-2]
MKIINVPSVAGSRALADRLVHSADLAPNESVLIDSRHLDVNTDSFVSELVKLVAEARPKGVEVVGGGKDWLADVERESSKHGLHVTVRKLTSA